MAEGGLGRGLTEIFADIEAANAARAAQGRTDGLDVLIPTNPNYLAERSKAQGVDPDFPDGYEILDPAPSRGIPDIHGNIRPRAVRAAYNAGLMVLAIKMRDQAQTPYVIRYDGVNPSDWISFQEASSTNDFIQEVLHAKPWRKTTKAGLPQTRRQSFETGSEE